MAKRDTTGIPKRRRKSKQQQQQEQPEANSGVLGSVLGQQYENRGEREAHLQRLIVIGIGGVLGLLTVLILGALLWESLAVPRQTVAVVNGETISIADFQERVRLERLIINQQFYNDVPFLQSIGLLQDPNQIIQQEPYATYWSEITGQPDVLGLRVLENMIEEEILRQEAAEMGITVDEAAVDERVEEFFNLTLATEEPQVTEEATEEITPTATPTPFVSPTPSPVPTDTPSPTPTPIVAAATEEVGATEEAQPSPTITPRPTDTPSPTPSNEERQADFEESLDRFYSEAGDVNLNRETVQRYFEFQLLLEQLREDVTADVEREAPHVNARHILVDTEEQAQQIIAALEEGESFADLARAVSTDSGSGARGGELGWSAASNYVPPFRDATISAEIGEIVGPVESEFGFHIIQVRAREDRELSENEFEGARDVAFTEWVEDVTSEENNDIEQNDNWPAHVPTDPFFDVSRILGGAEDDEDDDHNDM